LSNLFQELKRRNVFRVAIAYLAIVWLILQVADVVFNNIAAPDWLMPALMFFMTVGFPVALLFAWAFELTPEGIKREHEVDRSASIAHETGKKLNRTIIVVLAIAVVYLLADKFLTHPESTPEMFTVDKSVAVLPFVAMSSGENDEYFADGLTEEILNSLTRVPELLVTARTSAFHFKGQDIPLPEVAEKLGVAHVVEGSVRRDGERLRVTAQLVRASDGFHLWSENYDRSTDDTFGVQTDIAERIASALDVFLDDDELARMKSVGLRNPAAYVAYQRGIEAYNRSHTDGRFGDRLLAANANFEEVLALEPGASAVYLLHSDYYVHFLMEASLDAEITAEQQTEAFDRIRDDFENAIRTAPDETLRNAAAFDQALITGRWRSLPAIVDKVLDTPTCVQPIWLNITTIAYGTAERVLPHMQRLIQCDPIDYLGWWQTSSTQLWLGDIDAATETAREGYEKTGHDLARLALINALVASGQLDQAEAFIEQEVVSEQALLGYRLMLATAAGEKESVDTLFDELGRTGPEAIGRLARAGLRDEANARAASLDVHPFGYLMLMQLPLSCRCGAPFDLEAVPNFARLIDDANLSWPPVSPINWPLKDW